MGYLSGIEIIILLLISLLAISLVFNLATILDNNKKGKAGKERSVKTEDVVEKTLTNRRRSFRINFMEENKNCKVEVTHIGTETFDTNDLEEGRIVDISGTGMRLLLKTDYPIRKTVIIKVFFELDGEAFQIEGELVRKTEISKDKLVTYGIDFRNVPVVDENRLIKIIMTLSRDKNRVIINKKQEVRRRIVR